MGTGPEAKKSRVLSGMRPTGRMHLGNYFGALENWVRLQNIVDAQGKPQYDCFYFIADWHSLTSDYADTSAIAENTLQMMIDYLAGGLHPDKSVLFLQSLVPEHAELHLLLSMVTPLGWLERVPTYKEALENVKDKDLHNYGFLGYPVLQCADIVMYGEAGARLIVPTGEDQVSHVETSREIVRRFNLAYAEPVFRFATDTDLYAAATGSGVPTADFPDLTPSSRLSLKEKVSLLGRVFRSSSLQERGYYLANRLCRLSDVLTEPESMLTKTPRVPGTDGRKMSKSYGNTIMLTESDADIRAKTKVMVTDPARKRRTDPGNPDVCPAYDWHKLFAPKNAAGEYTAEGKATLDWAAHGCRTAEIGCIECKAAMAENLIKWIAPIRERRVKWENDPKGVLEILDDGSKHARTVAQATMERVREAVFGWEKKRKEIDGSAGSAKA